MNLSGTCYLNRQHSQANSSKSQVQAWRSCNIPLNCISCCKQVYMLCTHCVWTRPLDARLKSQSLSSSLSMRSSKRVWPAWPSSSIQALSYRFFCPELLKCSPSLIWSLSSSSTLPLYTLSGLPLETPGGGGTAAGGSLGLFRSPATGLGLAVVSSHDSNTSYCCSVESDAVRTSRALQSSSSPFLVYRDSAPETSLPLPGLLWERNKVW